MKRFYAIVLAILYVQYSSAQSANKRLSNLNDSTAVNADILPGNDDSIHIGSVSKSWKNLYLDGAVYMRGTRFISLPGGAGSYNTAIGVNVLGLTLAGYQNTGVGHNALCNNISGRQNTANGSYALYSNTSGNGNTANGDISLFSNINGSYNTANGMSALKNNANGNYNTASGVSALHFNTSGSGNAASGNSALSDNTTGSYNTADGVGALSSNTTGNFNTALGYQADVSTGSLSNATAVGNGAVVNSSNKVRIGNTSVTSIGGQVNWTTFSDGRYKKNIQENVKGLAFINALRPVSYTTDIKALEAYYHAGRNNDNADKDMEAIKPVAAAEGSKIVYTGFVAQEVEVAAKRLGYDFSGVDKPTIKDGVYGLRYSDFVAPLVKAVQELSKQNDSLRAKNDNLENRIARLEALIENQSAVTGKHLTTGVAAFIEQNMPNPFTHTTTIAYTLPAAFSSAKIIVTDMKGKQLKQFNVSGPGKGIIHVDVSTLAAGVYCYSLYIDGKLIGSKKMMRE